MGRASERAIEKENLERENQKYSTGLKYVCSDCFTDEHIREFIDMNSDKTKKCSYCGRMGAAPIKEVLDFIYERASRYFVPVEDDHLYGTKSFFDNDEEIPESLEDVDGFITSKEPIHTKCGIRYKSKKKDVDELLMWLNLSIQNQALYKDVKRRFEYANGYQQSTFLPKNSFFQREDEELILEWTLFEQKVRALMPKNESCCIFRKKKTIELDSIIEKLNGEFDQFFNSLKESICGADLIGQKLNDPKKAFLAKDLFRCRKLRCFDSVKSAADIVAPEPRYAQENRMTEKGESVLYCSLEEETAKAECKVEKHYAIGVIHPLLDLSIIDLINIPTDRSFFSNYNIYTLRFLREFSQRISQENDGTKLDYLPTQIMTKILRQLFGGLDGILYRSARVSGGRNVVLFFNHEQCLNTHHFQVKSLVEYNGTQVTRII